eukprot:scaffold10615_cov46-Phaeocystis_antarctica.AAC.1
MQRVCSVHASERRRTRKQGGSEHVARKQGGSEHVARKQGGSAFGQLALGRLLSAPEHTSGHPEPRPASANPPGGTRRAGTQAVSGDGFDTGHALVLGGAARLEVLDLLLAPLLRRLLVLLVPQRQHLRRVGQLDRRHDRGRGGGESPLFTTITI